MDPFLSVADLETNSSMVIVCNGDLKALNVYQKCFSINILTLYVSHIVLPHYFFEKVIGYFMFNGVLFTVCLEH